MDFTFHCASPLGGITLASDGEALTGLWFEGQEHFAETLDRRHIEKGLPVFDETLRWLENYFSGKAPDFTPKLAPRGTPFRRAVWEILLDIPYGRTMTYGEIAARLSERTGQARTSARAVGCAVARNPISLIIPCHRVLGSGGRLTGYAGGLERKAGLLQLEGVSGFHP
ncbi:MAG: methylated-DNA--[Clostridia bacterium]|nr:methylated-DNA--[protein]-cysteine S-methyltransferase [Clostridia bacterium]